MFLVFFARILRWNAFETVLVVTGCIVFSSVLLKTVADRVSRRVYRFFLTRPV